MIKSISRSLFVLLISIFLLSTLLTPAAQAINQSDIKSILSETTFYDPNTGCVDSTGSAVDITGAEQEKNAAQVWNYLISKGFAPMAAAGVLGNMQAESGIDPAKEEYVNHIGYGLAQWSYGRRINLENFARAQNKPVSDLGLQLDFLWHELNTTENATLIAMTKPGPSSVLAATTIWLQKFERAGDSSAQAAQNRNQYSEKWYQKFNGSITDNCDGSSATLSGPINERVVQVAKEELKKNGGIPEYGGTILEYTDGHQEAWCADFVSWVLNKAGAPFTGGASGGWRLANVGQVIAYAQSKDRYRDGQNYTPQPGDIRIEPGVHVNIVISVNPSNHTMVIIGGNQSDTVSSYSEDYTKYHFYQVGGN